MDVLVIASRSYQNTKYEYGIPNVSASNKKDVTAHANLVTALTLYWGFFGSTNIGIYFENCITTQKKFKGIV